MYVTVDRLRSTPQRDAPLHPSSEVDEAHDYKNLETESNIRDAAITGSKRAQDLHMKLEYLRSRHGARIATLATATPIANSITEAHVMSRYLRPDLLRHAGVEDFDAWAATFGQTVTEIEVDPAKSGDYRMHTRFARFQNVPEMLRMWHVFADVKTSRDLQLPVPQLAERQDGQRAPRAVLIEPSPELALYVEQLGERADKVRGGMVDPTEDNMLKITGDGRKAALDMRLVTGQPASTPGKLEAAAENIARLYDATREREYLDTITGESSPLHGALQIVFCDLSTPSEGWNAYEQLRDELVDRGLPAETIRFIHQARDDVEKARLFAACRAGHVNVLLGSTQKMGVGTARLGSTDSTTSRTSESNRAKSNGLYLSPLPVGVQGNETRTPSARSPSAPAPPPPAPGSAGRPRSASPRKRAQGCPAPDPLRVGRAGPVEIDRIAERACDGGVEPRQLLLDRRAMIG
jgi:hypothetical protein